MHEQTRNSEDKDPYPVSFDHSFYDRFLWHFGGFNENILSFLLFYHH